MMMKYLILSLFITPVLPAFAAIDGHDGIPYQGVEDLQTTVRVHDRLKASVRNYSSDNYTIYTQTGRVTIKGRVKSIAEENDIIKTANKVSGVKQVINNLIVDPNL
ncbi:hypothetical protein CIK05_01545 [Bdellovibrio sp. qaytius]|nr:hypothetical protein CIK05_01545 [Bdellovibrio sp. qaytius]